MRATTRSVADMVRIVACDNQIGKLRNCSFPDGAGDLSPPTSVPQSTAAVPAGMRQWRPLFIIFSVAVALNLYAWYVHPDRPSLSHTVVTGWYGGGADQLNYAREARALSHGTLPGLDWDYAKGEARPNLPPGTQISDYAYGLGYPLLGVPFIWIGLNQDPFVIPNAIAFGLLICMAWCLARRFLSEEAALIFAGALAVASPLLPFTVQPWNTITTAIAILTALLIATSDRRGWKVGVALGATISLCYAARFSDAFWPIVIVAAGFLPSWHERKGTLTAVSIAALMLVATYLAVGWTQIVVFGDFFLSPYHYHFHNSVRGDSLADFQIAQAPWAFIQVFLTAMSRTGRVAEPHTSILRAMPWVVATPAGVVWLIRRRHPHRDVMIAAALASIAASIFYLAYWSGTGDDIQHDNMRFFVPWLPLWGLFAAVAIEILVRRFVRTISPAG